MTNVISRHQQRCLILQKKASLRQLNTILLLIAFVTQTFNQTFIVAGYYANKDAYAKNCINRTKPKMHCNGKCQMMKKLQQEESRDKQNPDQKSNNKNDLYFSFNQSSVDLFSTLLTINYPSFNNTYSKEITSAFFQPPRA